jgi:IMP dehydrogenase
MQEALTFDDVLLVPQYSGILPADAELSTKLSRNISLDIPVVSAPMDTITEHTMAVALASVGGIGIIHRNLSVSDQAKEVKQVKKAGKDLLVGAAVGTSKDALERSKALVEAGVDVIIVDTAHGHSKGVIDTVKLLKKDSNITVDIIAGNIATAQAAKALVEAGVDALKVGMGPGAICTTRIVAGIGVPQLTAIMEVVRGRAKNHEVPVIADGGIRYSGDIVKALAAGASSVMVGSVLAGTDETPGDIETDNGKKYKQFRGMGSIGAMSAGSANRYGQDKVKKSEKFVPEGIEGRVPYRGPVSKIIHQLSGGIRSGMGYMGSKGLQELQKKAEFVKVSKASVRESHPHDVEITVEAPNYQL